MSGILDDYKQLRMIEITKQLQQLKAENRELKAYRDVMEQADFKGSFDKMCVENRKLIAKLEDIEDICRNCCYLNADDIQEEILQILKGE